MRVFVTGGSGFLGKFIARRLLAEGREVAAYARRPLPELEALGARVFLGELSDRRALGEALAGADAAIHCAGRVGVWGPYAEFMSVNAEGTQSVLAAAERAGVSSFIYASSPSVVYGGRNLTGINESEPYLQTPLDNYSYSKAVAERAVLAANKPGFRTLALRPHLIWGPEDPHFTPRILSLRRRNRLRLFTGGPYVIDATYIDNAVEAHLLAMARIMADERVAGQAFFIAQDEPLDALEFINLLLKAARLAPVAARTPPWLGRSLARLAEGAWRLGRLRGEPPLTLFAIKQLTTSHYFDLAKAKTLLGYKPKISLSEGLRRLEDYLFRDGGPDARP
ncbi:MAG: NAD-dependent epimerase/dehydratase family protein [Deltaproteobacteria bacterium]|jgi:nucleoside-diphosphate-sugar epimerase|nr:NAD-dependent epimerase/dehydratase family protein [Deltaproteobacteria bacterium]